MRSPRVNAGTAAPEYLARFDTTLTPSGAANLAQLAVVPGSSHMVPLEKPVLVNRLILDFLSDHQPEKMMSLRG